jgi:hypothetical protein
MGIGRNSFYDIKWFGNVHIQIDRLQFGRICIMSPCIIYQWNSMDNGTTNNAEVETRIKKSS